MKEVERENEIISFQFFQCQFINSIFGKIFRTEPYDYCSKIGNANILWNSLGNSSQIEIKTNPSRSYVLYVGDKQACSTCRNRITMNEHHEHHPLLANSSIVDFI